MCGVCVYKRKNQCGEYIDFEYFYVSLRTEKNIFELIRMDNVKQIWKSEDGDIELTLNEDTKDLIFIRGDIVTYIEPVSNLEGQVDVINYVGKWLPASALAVVARRLKGLE